MRLNIFKIPYNKRNDLKDKFKSVGLRFEHAENINGWNCSFYLSHDPVIKNISWVNDFDLYIKSKIENKIYFAVFLCEQDKDVFALTYGKSHFYVRQFCDEEFGLNMAKRIADEKDVKQVVTKRFNSRKKKEVKSYIKASIFDNESGESVEHIDAIIIEKYKDIFGNKVKFGHSILVSKKELQVNDIPNLLNNILDILKAKELFEIPKTEKIKIDSEITKYTSLLVEDLLKKDEKVGFSTDSFDVVGVDIVFSGNEKYKYLYHKKESEEFEDLNIVDLLKFIKDNNIPDNKILASIKIEVTSEGRKTFMKRLSNFIFYNVENKNIIYQNGQWIKFNDEYVKQIDNSVDSINIEDTETEFKEISKTETEFNCLIGDNSESKTNADLIKYGYKSADKNFDKVKLPGNYKVEVWDLQKDETVYAIKFGNTQKLVYVVNQAINFLEILRNNASINPLKDKVNKYVLWLGITNKKEVKKISELNSIILKQQIDLFARKCRELGIEPAIKISKKIKDDNKK